MSGLAKRSVIINGRKTSVSIEDQFWSALRDIAKSRRETMIAVVSEIDDARKGGSLSSAIRIWVMEHFRNSAHGAAIACLAVLISVEAGGFIL